LISKENIRLNQPQFALHHCDYENISAIAHRKMKLKMNRKKMREAPPFYETNNKPDPMASSATNHQHFTSTGHIPVNFRINKNDRSPMSCCLIAFGLTLAFWIALFAATDLKSSFMAMVMGITAGLIYGNRKATRSNGMVPMTLVFIFSLAVMLAINIRMTSEELAMNIRELTDHFGYRTLTQVVLEKLNFADVIFLVLAVLAAGIATKFTNSKKIKAHNNLLNTKYHDTRRTSTNL
jgi:hypothetical protein